MKLALAALLWLHPMQTNGLIEATSEPSLGIRRTIEITGTDFGFALGTGYQALRAGVTIPAEGGYLGGRAEVEHLWRDGEESIYYRIHVPMGKRRPFYLTEEWRLRKYVAWGQEDPDYRGSGRRIVGHTREQRLYVTYHSRRILARIGVAGNTPQDMSLGFNLSAQW